MSNITSQSNTTSPVQTTHTPLPTAAFASEITTESNWDSWPSDAAGSWFHQNTFGTCEGILGGCACSCYRDALCTTFVCGDSSPDFDNDVASLQGPFSVVGQGSCTADECGGLSSSGTCSACCWCDVLWWLMWWFLWFWLLYSGPDRLLKAHCVLGWQPTATARCMVTAQRIIRAFAPPHIPLLQLIRQASIYEVSASAMHKPVTPCAWWLDLRPK